MPECVFAVPSHECRRRHDQVVGFWVESVCKLNRGIPQVFVDRSLKDISEFFQP